MSPSLRKASKILTWYEAYKYPSFQRTNQIEMSGPPMLTKEEYEQRKHALEDFKSLDKDEYEEIFRIIKRNNIPFTENNNGVHFDLCYVDQETILQILKFLELCKAQRANEEVRSKEMDTLRSLGNVDA